MRESAIVAAVLRTARERGWFCWKNHGGPYALQGLPDAMFVRGGLLVALEVKRPSERPTAIQEAILAKLAAAGAVVGVVRSAAEAEVILAEAERRLASPSL